MLRLSLISDGHGWLKQEFVEAKSGRVYGRGLSNLALTPNVLLEHMLEGCVELDIEACSSRLFPQICRKLLGEAGLRFDAMEEYAFRKECKTITIVGTDRSEREGMDSGKINRGFSDFVSEE